MAEASKAFASKNFSAAESSARGASLELQALRAQQPERKKLPQQLLAAEVMQEMQS